MFPRERRLARHRDIQRILKTGRRVSTPALMMRHLPNERTYPRVTVVVGTAVSKRATVRNKLKRQLRELLRHELKGVAVGADIMLSTRAAALKHDYQALGEMVHFLLQRAGILNRR
jgi:ribonuclease P protein component